MPLILYFYTMTPDQKKINVVFSVTNCICFDQRVLKMAGVLEKMNANITIIGRRKGPCCDKNLVPYKTVRFRMLFKKGFLFYKFFNIRLFFWLLFNKSDLLVANDLDTLLPNFLISRIKRIPLVYDSHEYFTGLPELKERSFVKSVWKFIETLCFPHLKYVITVSEGIANIYEKEYRKKPAVIKNFSPSTSEIKAKSREQLGINENSFVVIIQGTGINIDKGGEELIEAIALTDNIFLIVAGSGDVLPFMKKKVRELNVENRVIFTGTLPWNELISYTKVADAGMVLEKDTNLNYRFSLPNKLFDYISAGIPVISSNLPLISEVIIYYNCGIIIPEVTPAEISDAIKMLSGNQILYKQLKKNCAIASSELNWEKESEKVKIFYSNLFDNEFSRKYAKIEKNE